MLSCAGDKCCSAPPSKPVSALPPAREKVPPSRPAPTEGTPCPDTAAEPSSQPAALGLCGRTRMGSGLLQTYPRGARSGAAERERPRLGVTRGWTEMRPPQGNGPGPAPGEAGGQELTQRYRTGWGRAVRTGAPGHKEALRAAAAHSGPPEPPPGTPRGRSAPPPSGPRRHRPKTEAAPGLTPTEGGGPGSPRGEAAAAQLPASPRAGQRPAALRKAPRDTAGSEARRDPARRPRSTARPRSRCLPPSPRRPEPRSAGLLPALKLAEEASLPSLKMAAAASRHVGGRRVGPGEAGGAMSRAGGGGARRQRGEQRGTLLRFSLRASRGQPGCPILSPGRVQTGEKNVAVSPN